MLHLHKGAFTYYVRGRSNIACSFRVGGRVGGLKSCKLLKSIFNACLMRGEAGVGGFDYLILERVPTLYERGQGEGWGEGWGRAGEGPKLPEKSCVTCERPQTVKSILF